MFLFHFFQTDVNVENIFSLAKLPFCSHPPSIPSGIAYSKFARDYARQLFTDNQSINQTLLDACASLMHQHFHRVEQGQPLEPLPWQRLVAMCAAHRLSTIPSSLLIAHATPIKLTGVLPYAPDESMLLKLLDNGLQSPVRMKRAPLLPHTTGKAALKRRNTVNIYIFLKKFKNLNLN